MDISVLMSVYGKDNPGYYRLALESVTSRQVLKPKQAVIVFDGPVPDEIEIITKEVEEKNPEICFAIVRQKTNKGLAAALNTGLRSCSCEYVARMDSDDISEPERFRLQADYLQKHPETDLLGGFISEFIDDPQKSTSVRKVGCDKESILRMAKRRTPFNHVSVIYRKESVLAVGGYAEDFGKLEDYRLWVDMISAGMTFSNIDDILVNVRVGDGQLRRRSNAREITDWDHLQQYLLNAGIINRMDSMINMAAIRVFTYMPVGLKKIAYQTVLRRKNNKPQ